MTVTNREMNHHYFSQSHVVTATESVRNFSRIRQQAERHPVHIRANNGAEQTLLSKDAYTGLIAQHGAEDDIDYRAKLDLVLDSIDTHVTILDHDMNVRRMNLAVRRAMKLPDVPPNTPTHNVTDTAYHEYVLSRAKSVSESGIAQRFEASAPYDRERVRSVRILPWQGGVAIFSKDVSDAFRLRELKAHRKALTETLSLFEGVGQGIIDGSGRLADVSDGLVAMLAAPNKDAVIGSRLLSLFTPESHAALEPLLFRSQSAQKCEVDLIVQGISTVRCEFALSAYWLESDGRSHAFTMRTLSEGAVQTEE